MTQRRAFDALFSDIVSLGLTDAQLAGLRRVIGRHAGARVVIPAGLVNRRQRVELALRLLGEGEGPTEIRRQITQRFGVSHTTACRVFEEALAHRSHNAIPQNMARNVEGATEDQVSPCQENHT